jgi:zinc transport system substrate-binding protein
MRLWLGMIGIVFVLAAFGLAACGVAAREGQDGAKPMNVVVTIAPLKGLVEPLLPKGSMVTVLIQPGKSEHGYEFTPADMASVAKADLVVYVGLGLEGRLEGTVKKQEGKGQRVVCFADAVGIKTPEGGEHEDDDHDSKGEHEHHEHGPGYVDPHLWLDPVLVEKLVPELKKAVVSAEGSGVTPEESKRIDAAAASLVERVKGVDKEWTDRLAPLKGKSVVTHHNAFGRPSERYGFKVAAVIREFETSDPSPGDLAKVVEAIRTENVKTIFVEPQFNGVAAERIAKMSGVKVGHLDPLGDGDWFKMMKGNLDALVSGLSEGEPVKPAGGK